MIQHGLNPATTPATSMLAYLQNAPRLEEYIGDEEGV